MKENNQRWGGVDEAESQTVDRFPITARQLFYSSYTTTIFQRAQKNHTSYFLSDYSYISFLNFSHFCKAVLV